MEIMMILIDYWKSPLKKFSPRALNIWTLSQKKLENENNQNAGTIFFDLLKVQVNNWGSNFSGA